MNFDFLNGLQGFGYVHINCNNAEKLAVAMPDQSIFTSRKSAELIARFLYLAAHNEQMENMTFVEILGDPAVRDFIGDQKVMSAFHYIRKSGNRAVHADDPGTAAEAVNVLEDLHYVAGETACMLGLIDNYPEFDNKIAVYPEAKYEDEKDIEAKALKMFSEYAQKYDAQKEREHYYQNNVDNLIAEFDSMCSGMIMLPGDVELNEELEFKHKPVHEVTIKVIQSYFGFLGIRALKKLCGELPEELRDRELNYHAELTLYGENGYTTETLPEFVHGIMHDLPSADGFKITSNYFGPSVDPWFKSNSKERKNEFSWEVSEICKQEEFTYSTFEFLHNHGEARCAKLENGEWVDLEGQFSNDIVKKTYENKWWTSSVMMRIELDFEKHSDILKALRNCVRKHIPSDQLIYCEQSWADGEQEILVDDIQWCENSLKIIQDFLDELNGIVKPIGNEFKAYPYGCWYQTESPFAIAAWRWTEDGFKIMGTEI